MFVVLVMLGGALIDFGIQLAVADDRLLDDPDRYAALGGDVTGTGIYPLPGSIYTKIVRIVLTFVLPFAFMNYFPASYLLQKHEGTLSLAPEVGLLTPLVGIVWVDWHTRSGAPASTITRGRAVERRRPRRH